MVHTTYIYIIIGALIGLLIGLLIAEIGFRKSAKHANHVVPATIVNNHTSVVKQKIIYYGVLVTFLGSSFLLGVKIPDLCYSLVSFAIVGGDIQKLATKFFRLK